MGELLFMDPIVLLAGVVVFAVFAFSIVIVHGFRASKKSATEELLCKIRDLQTHVDSMANLKRAKAEIEEVDVLRRKFIQVVGHQLRTPLNAIRWNLEAIMGGELGPLSPEQLAFVRVTHDADVEVIKRISDMLTALDIEEGRVSIHTESVSVETIWDGARPAFMKECEAKNLHCGYRPPLATLPRVNADADHLREVFEKLCENAVSYTPAGGSVTVTLSGTRDKVRFEIADTGVGVPTLDQPHLFTRFFRGSNAAVMKPDSSGLGLALSRYFVELMNGTIGFRSEEGKGSTFWVELPALK